MVAATAKSRAETPNIIRMSGVRFVWPGRDAFSLAVDGFSLPVAKRILLLGPSGSGKSTFLSLICGIVAPQTGEIDILGTDITKLPASARDGFRAEHFGIIFQIFNLLPYGTVIDNVLLPLSFAPGRRARATANSAAEDEAVRLLTCLGLEPDLTRGPSAANLSVGQQQRVAAARALIGSPEINRQAAFLDLLFTQVGDADATLIMVSHDESLAGRFDEVMRLETIAISGRGERM